PRANEPIFPMPHSAPVRPSITLQCAAKTDSSAKFSTSLPTASPAISTSLLSSRTNRDVAARTPEFEAAPKPSLFALPTTSNRGDNPARGAGSEGETESSRRAGEMESSRRDDAAQGDDGVPGNESARRDDAAAREVKSD